jgi:alkanesulfonate monooxygenase SsuD/methylene tetrahydromethanopterin reductase-like flavin-dependent oxidoreductase (luciferase family)
MTNGDLRLGYAVGPTIPEPISAAVERVEALEAAGFDSVWLPDHLLVTPRGFMPEAWTLLTTLAGHTEDITLATGVTDPHRRGPGLLAQSAATLDHVSDGRFLMGIGPGEAMSLDPFGYDWDRPVSKLVETVEVVRRLWDGETFDYDGEFFELEDAFLQILPEHDIPIYFGANGPRTRTLSGRMADGWYPIMESPTTYETHLENVQNGVDDAGREMADVDLGLQIPVGAARDEEELNRLRMYAASTLALVPGKLEAAGYEVDFPEDMLSDYFQDHLADDESEQQAMELAKHVPLEAADEFGIFGTPEEFIEQIEAFQESGVEHFALMNMSSDPEATIDAFGEVVIPYFDEA